MPTAIPQNSREQPEVPGAGIRFHSLPGLRKLLLLCLSSGGGGLRPPGVGQFPRTPGPSRPSAARFLASLLRFSELRSTSTACRTSASAFSFASATTAEAFSRQAFPPEFLRTPGPYPSRPVRVIANSLHTIFYRRLNLRIFWGIRRFAARFSKIRRFVNPEV